MTTYKFLKFFLGIKLLVKTSSKEFSVVSKRENGALRILGNSEAEEVAIIKY